MPVAESIDQDVLLRTIDRERQSRLMSERLLEDKSRALYLSKEKVQEQYESLKQTQGQLLHSEKMASVGQLAAGVAHEINNPIGFVTSNVQTLTDLLKESYDGLVRVREIVQNLKSFVHLDKSEVQLADINEGLEATLKVVWNELKYKCQVEKKFGDLPRVRCFAGERNQVFLNLIVNAAEASRKNISRSCSIRSSQPNRSEKAPVWDSLFRTELSGSMTETSPLIAQSGKEQRLPFVCRSVASCQRIDCCCERATFTEKR